MPARLKWTIEWTKSSRARRRRYSAFSMNTLDPFSR